MKKFEKLEKYLSRYTKIKENGKIYYLLNNKIIGYKQNNLIVLYFECNPEVIWNHNDLVKVGFIKDFQLVKFNGSTYIEKKADVIIVKGYCGTSNGFNTYKNIYAYEKTDNNIIEKEHAIGKVIKKGHFVTFDEKLDILVPEYLCDFQIEDLNYSIISQFKNCRKRKEKYDLQEHLYLVEDWYFKAGYETVGSATTRENIYATKKCNYKKVGKAKIKFK